MKQAVLVFAIALVITLAIGPAVINYLRKMKFGQKILEIGPKWHMNKQNIPTMGGFMFIIGIAAAVIIGNIVMGEISVSSLAVLGLAVAYGAVGLVDDYAKIKKKENAGLTPKQKLVLQILVAGVFILVLFLGSSGLPQLWIPFTGISFSWPWPLYIVFAAFVIVGADNAVNLTDDGNGSGTIWKKPGPRSFWPPWSCGFSFIWGHRELRGMYQKASRQSWDGAWLRSLSRPAWEPGRQQWRCSPDFRQKRWWYPASLFFTEPGTEVLEQAMRLLQPVLQPAALPEPAPWHFWHSVSFTHPVRRPWGP